MTVFTTTTLNTWRREYQGTDRSGNTVIRHRSEFPIEVFLRWLTTTDTPDEYKLKLDLKVTDFGDEILARNAPSARQWIESNFSSYPDDLDNNRVRDLQQICEYVRDGRSGPVSFETSGGTFTVESEEQLQSNGQLRTLITATITTPDTFTLTIEDALQATVDTTQLS